MRKFMTILVAMTWSMLAANADAQRVETLTGQMTASGGVSVDQKGDIYVADFGARLNNANGTRVYKVLRDGTISVFANGLQGASGNSFDSKGNLFQSNISGGRISKITPDGTVSTFVSANIVGPVGIAIGAGDTVFVANCRNPGEIVKVTPQGQSSILARSSLLSCPNGLTIDDDGNLYTCNFNNGNVIKITQEGTVSVLTTIPGNNNGHLTFANGVLYVVARCANQIYEVTLSGGQRLLAGSGGRGNQDGMALEASFSIPNGIRASPDGDTLYVNDAVPVTGGCTGGNLNPVVVRMIIGVREFTTGVSARDDLEPVDFILGQNYPNPFNPTTTIEFAIESAAHVSLVVYNPLGQKVRTLIDEVNPAGAHSVTWDGLDDAGRIVSAGLYLYEIKAGPELKTKKMLLIE